MHVLDALHASYIARHWQSIDDMVRPHLDGFLAHIREAVESAESITEDQAAEFLRGHGWTVTAPAPGESPVIASIAETLNADPATTTEEPTAMTDKTAPEPERTPMSLPELAQADPAPAEPADNSGVIQGTPDPETLPTDPAAPPPEEA